MRSFVVPLWVFILDALCWFSPYFWITKLIPHRYRNRGTTDLWVILNFWMASAWCIFIAGTPMTPIRWIVLVYGVARIGEILVHQAQVVLLEPISLGDDARRNHVRTMLLSLSGYFEVILWFAGIYRCFPYLFNQPQVTASWDGAIYHSVMTVSTLGFGDIAPDQSHSGGRLLTVAHIVVSLFLNLVVLTRLIANLPTQAHSAD